jgi:hypothetical protein
MGILMWNVRSSYLSLLYLIIGRLASDANTITILLSNGNFANLDFLPLNGNIAELVTNQTYLTLNQTSLLYPLDSLPIHALPMQLCLNLILFIIIIYSLSYMAPNIYPPSEINGQLTRHW